MPRASTCLRILPFAGAPDEVTFPQPMRAARRQAVLLLLPCALALVLLFVLPQMLMFEASLGRRSAYGGVVHAWSAANYVRALEPIYLAILARSLGLALVTT